MNFLLDTNVVLYLLGGVIPGHFEHGNYFISVITEIELLSYPSLCENEETKIRSFLSDVSIIDINATVKDETIKLRRAYLMRLPDAIIAASAITMDATLISNDKIFKKLAGIKLRDVKLKNG